MPVPAETGKAQEGGGSKGGQRAAHKGMRESWGFLQDRPLTPKQEVRNHHTENMPAMPTTQHAHPSECLFRAVLPPV